MQMPQCEEAGERGVKADPLSETVSSEGKLPFLRPSGIFRISLLCSFMYLCRVTSKYSVQGEPPPPTSTPTPAFLPLTTAPLSFNAEILVLLSANPEALFTQHGQSLAPSFLLPTNGAGPPSYHGSPVKCQSTPPPSPIFLKFV